MTALPPDQLQALQAVIAQQAPAQAEAIAQSIAVTVQSAPIDVDALARAITIDGTATKQGTSLDQLLIRTGQGDFVLRLPDAARQQILDSLPSRVSIQLRPGPNGLEAVLVVGSRAAQQVNQVEQSFVSTNASSRQTLSSEIPKVGQVFQVAVLPSTLLSNLLTNQNGGLGRQPIATTQGQVGTPVPAQTGEANAAPVQTPNQPVLSAPLKAALDALKPATAEAAAAGKTSAPPTPLIGTDVKKDDAVKIPVPNSQNTVTPQASRPQLLPLRILNVANPGEPLTAQPDKTFTATVRGTTPSGQPVISINDELAVVNTTKNWPVGTKIQIALGAGAELVTDKEVKPLPVAFESLLQLTELLAQQNPLLLNELKRTRIPQGQTGQIAGPLLFFMVALQKGNVAQWLGNDVKDLLQATENHSLLQKLQDEFTGSKQPAIDNMGSPWRGMNVPYLDGDKMQQFRFFVHEDNRQKQQQAERDIARRFLIDVSLTRLGPVQIDGLVHQKKLDLIVRTGNNLDESLRMDLRARFQSAMEEIRYTGSLIFQANKQGWVELKTAHPKGVEKAI